LLFTMLYVAIAKRNNRQDFSLNKEEKFFIYLILFWFGWQLLGVFYQPVGYEYETIRGKLRAFDNPSRWVLLLPVFFLFRQYVVNWKLMAFGMGLGVIVTVAIAHYQIYFLGLIRAEGSSGHPITFGELMVAADLMLWMLMTYAWNNGNKVLSSFLLFSSVVAFYGSLLSVTRGAWLAYIVMILIWIIYTVKKSVFDKRHLFSKPILLRLFLALIVFFVVSKTEQYTTIEVRSTNTYNNMVSGKYYALGGDRLKIYKDAIHSIKEYPLGVGTNNFRKIDQEGISYGHAHNDILNSWAEIGVQGAISLVLLILWVFGFFWKNLKHTNELISVYSSCGLMLVASYLIFGATQAVFNHHQYLLFFIFYLYFFFAQIQAINKKS